MTKTKTIINFTPTGIIPTKEMTPYVPVSVSEIVDNVLEARETGITMVHLHARDEEGKPTHRADVYARIIDGIRAVDRELVICVSTSGRATNTFEARSEVLYLDGDVKPDMASLTLGSLNFAKTASVNSPDMIKALATKMYDKGIMPELEAFSVGMVNYANYLWRRSLIPHGPLYFNLIVGLASGAQATPLHIGAMVAAVEEFCITPIYSVGGVGNYQLAAHGMAIAMGAGVRVGLEDMIYMTSERKQFATNSWLVQRIHDLMEIHERELLTSAQFRAAMSMSPGNGRYGWHNIPASLVS